MKINKRSHLILTILLITNCNQNIISSNLRKNYNIVCDGNSLTAGQGSPVSYPRLLEHKLRGKIKFKVTNIGVCGQTTLDMLYDEKLQLDSLFDPDSENILFVWEIRNHLIRKCPEIDSAKTAFVRYCRAAQNIGYKVYVLTLLPSYTSNYCNDTTEFGYKGLEQHRLLINNWLKVEYKTFANGIINIAEDSLIGQTNQNQKKNYQFSHNHRPQKTKYYFDGTHLTIKGYNIIADYCKNKILENENYNIK